MQLLIKKKDIATLEQIGQGGYGAVYRGRYFDCPVAIKDYIKPGKNCSLNDFMKEVQVLNDLKHPNIVLYMGIYLTHDKYQLVT